MLYLPFGVMFSTQNISIFTILDIRLAHGSHVYNIGIIVAVAVPL